MQIHIVWGKILSGKLDEYEAAFKQALAERGPVKGLHNQWLVRDQSDPDALKAPLILRLHRTSRGRLAVLPADGRIVGSAAVGDGLAWWG